MHAPAAEFSRREKSVRSGQRSANRVMLCARVPDWRLPDEQAAIDDGKAAEGEKAGRGGNVRSGRDGSNAAAMRVSAAIKAHRR